MFPINKQPLHPCTLLTVGLCNWYSLCWLWSRNLLFMYKVGQK